MSQSHPWGKRPRENDSEEFVRFSDLSPEQKLARRQQERQEKKGRERTMSYFLSVQRVLDEHAGGGGDVNTLTSIVDGFFVELVKLLKADPSFYILRNGTVCRVIEAALANSLLLHIKSLLYVFLGRIPELLASPVASYTVETLLASMSQALGALAESPEKLEAELTEGGPGIHPGSGVPSSATLVASMAEELAERAGDLLVHDVGSRGLRSVILVLGGYSIRSAPVAEHPIIFSATLGGLAEAIIKALEEGYGREYGTASASESWMAAAQTPASSFVVQSLLKTCEEGSRTDRAVRQRLEGLQYQDEPLLLQFMLDPMGSHIFQAYIKVPTPRAVIAAAEAAGAQRKPASTENTDAVRLLEDCCWGRALSDVASHMSALLRPGSELVQQAGFILQDLVLYAPTAAHLRLFWERLVEPHVDAYFNISALAAVLVTLVRKCAFSHAAAVHGEEDEQAAGPTAPPADIVAQLKKDEGQHVRYFAVSVDFQREVCAKLGAAMKAHTPKGAAQYLLVDALMGDKGYELARLLLFLHPNASTYIQHSLDKLKVEDLVHIAVHHKGSLALQQYLRVSSLKSAADDKGAPQRFLRRIQDHLPELISDKYAAYVVETLFDVASLDGKERLVQLLLPVYRSLKTSAGTSAEEGGDEAAALGAASASAEGSSAPPPQTAASRRYVTRKVLTKCCVEQYVHRPDDWRKLAQRQCQVQRLLQRMVLDA